METTTNKEIKPNMTFEDYSKADIRICQIISVEKATNADKLYILKINTGVDERQVVSAIADKITPEQLLGRKMPFILNFPVRKLKGHESFGMIIMAEGKDGKLYDFTNDSAEIGAIVI
jgi:methionyl-tRNA synthetase